MITGILPWQLLPLSLPFSNSSPPPPISISHTHTHAEGKRKFKNSPSSCRACCLPSRVVERDILLIHVRRKHTSDVISAKPPGEPEMDLRTHFDLSVMRIAQSTEFKLRQKGGLCTQALYRLRIFLRVVTTMMTSNDSDRSEVVACILFLVNMICLGIFWTIKKLAIFFISFKFSLKRSIPTHTIVKVPMLQRRISVGLIPSSHGAERGQHCPWKVCIHPDSVCKHSVPSGLQQTWLTQLPSSSRTVTKPSI